MWTGHANILTRGLSGVSWVWVCRLLGLWRVVICNAERFGYWVKIQVGSFSFVLLGFIYIVCGLLLDLDRLIIIIDEKKVYKLRLLYLCFYLFVPYKTLIHLIFSIV